MGDFHQVVVHNIGEMVGGQLIGALVEHFVVEHRGIDDYVASDDVTYMNILSGLNLEAHHILRASSQQLIYLILRQSKGVAHLHASGCIVLEIGQLGSLGGKLLRSVKRKVCGAVVKQNVYILLINIAAFRLAVGAVLAANAYTFVKIYTEPAKTLDDVFFSPGHKASGVGILNAENHFAAVLTGKEIVIERCAYAADMQRPSRAGGKAYSYFSCFHWSF